MAKATADHAISIADKMKEADFNVNLKSGEPLGIFFPVHGWKPPKILIDFVAKAHLDTEPSYCYALCSCGDSIGETISVLRQALAKRGVLLNSAFSVIMPETYVCLPFMYTDTIDNEQRKISSALQKLNDISLIVQARKDNCEDLIKGPLPWFFTHVVGSFFNKFMITDRPFKVDGSLCSHCGKCARVCPVTNISYAPNGLPEWKKNGKCTCCMACYHHCPHHAIDYGKITKARGQYYFGIHQLTNSR